MYVVINQRGQDKCFSCKAVGQTFRLSTSHGPSAASLGGTSCGRQGQRQRAQCSRPLERDANVRSTPGSSCLVPSSLLLRCGAVVSGQQAAAASMLISLTGLPVTSCFSSCFVFSSVHLREPSSFRCAALGPASQDLVLTVYACTSSQVWLAIRSSFFHFIYDSKMPKAFFFFLFCVQTDWALHLYNVNYQLFWRVRVFFWILYI